MHTEESITHTFSADNGAIFRTHCCPCIMQPFIDCYCVNMTSQKIALAVEYCGGNYENCEIYCRNKFQETP